MDGMIAATALALLLPGQAARSEAQEWMQVRSDGMRAQAGLPPLVAGAALDALAQTHAVRISRGWRDPRFKSRHSFTTSARELIAVTGTSDPFENWISAPTHRGDLLDRRWTRCGFGCATDCGGWRNWVALYK